MPPSLKDDLIKYMDANGGGDGLFVTAIDGLFLMRSSTELLPQHILYRPALCITVQGAKQVVFGEEVFHYREMQALVVSVELPGIGRVTRATADAPYLGIVLQLDLGAMRDVMGDLDSPPKPRDDVGLGVFVDDLGGPLTDCVLRLIRLLKTPKAIPILYPLIMREISYWLLAGANGDEVCKLATPNGHTQRITEAIYLLREDFARPIRIEQLATTARMSPSSFHQHFKTLTSMTPLQYQKQLRLLEARRLMAVDGVSVTSAAYRVGYESASQFSREYGRMFGLPPRRDATEAKRLYHPDEHLPTLTVWQ
jgi:AraC-like DNA-binding protein